MKILSISVLGFWFVAGVVFFSSRAAQALDCATYLTGIELSCKLAATDDGDYEDCVYSNMASGGFEDEEDYTMAGEEDDGFPLFTCGTKTCVKAIAKFRKTCALADQNAQKTCFKSSLEKGGLMEGTDFRFSSKSSRLFCK